MEQNIKRSETIIKKNRDDWVDEKGYLHTKFTKETITGPLDNVQASQPLNVPLIPSIFNSIMRKRPRMMMRQPVQQVQPIQPVQPQQQIPDMSALISMGRKLLEESGIDFQDLVKDAFKTVSKDEPLEDKVEPLVDKADALIDEKEVKDSKWQKKQKPLKKNQKTKRIQKKVQNNKN